MKPGAAAETALILVAYLDRCPDTITARVKSVRLLPWWTCTMFLFFLCFGWKICLSNPATRIGG
jgi:hypothetical protein